LREPWVNSGLADLDARDFLAVEPRIEAIWMRAVGCHQKMK
jgi:hypothetical protein